jgi:hypothetical protein
MKILGQVVAVQPLALIVSLPNQLLGHVPITNITSQLTSKLESMDEEMERGSDVDMEGDAEDDAEVKAPIPDLLDMFRPGQYVRTVVVIVHPQGSTTFSVLGSRPRDDMEKASRRVELSLLPDKVNVTIKKADLKPGYVSRTVLISYVVSLNSFLDFVCCNTECRGPWLHPRPWHSRYIRFPSSRGRSGARERCTAHDCYADSCEHCEIFEERTHVYMFPRLGCVCPTMREFTPSRVFALAD